VVFPYILFSTYLYTMTVIIGMKDSSWN